MSCVEAVEAFKRGWQRYQVFSRQLEPVFIGMVVRSESVGLSGRVQFNVAAQDISERPRLQKLDNPFELPPNLWARSGPMEGTRTEDRRRDDLNDGGYAPPEGEAFCRPYPAIVPRSFSLAASFSDPRQRRYQLEELCRSRGEDRENLLRTLRKDSGAG